MSVLLALVMATAIGARVESWEHYVHYGSISALQMLPDSRIAIGTSGGVIIAGNEEGWAVDSILGYPGRLSHSVVRALELDSEGSLWVGTYGGGIDVVHPDGSWTHYGQLEGLPLDQEINTILTDTVVWAGTTEGLAIKELGYFVTWDTYSTGGGLPSNDVSCLAMADSGLIVGTGSAAGAVMLLSGQDPGESDSWFFFAESAGLTFNDLAEGQDTLWAATSEGLYFFADTAWVKDPSFPADAALCIDISGEDLVVGGHADLLVRSSGIWSSSTSPAFLGVNVCDVIWAGEDSIVAGRVWQLSPDRASGPGVAAGFGEEWSNFLVSGAPSNELRSVCVGGDGGCWVGSEDNGAGVLHADQEEWAVYRYELPNGKQLFACDSEFDGGVFISCYHFGVAWIDWKGTIEKSDDDIVILNTENSGLLNDQILSVGAEPGAVWFTHEPYWGTPTEPSGVSRLQWDPGDEASQSWQSWTSSDGIPSEFVGAVEPIGDGVAWIGASTGLVRLDSGTGSIWPSQPIDTGSGLPADSITHVLELPTGMLYIGTSAGLATLPSGSTLAEPVEDITGTIRGLALDHLSNVWVGTEGSLYQIEPDGNIEVYSVLNSPLLAASIRGLAVDYDRGFVYAATSRGLWKLDVGSGLSEEGDRGPTVFPNPFIPDGQTALRIAGLPNQATTVQVFDLGARLVYQSLTPDRDSFAWTGLDDDGETVPAGTYIVRIQQEGVDHLFKLAVIR